MAFRRAARIMAALVVVAGLAGHAAGPAGAVNAGAFCTTVGTITKSSTGTWLSCASKSLTGAPYDRPRWRTIPLTQLGINDAPHTMADYDRQTQFGGWIDTDRDCQNTRNEVLVQESWTAPTYTTAAQCAVATGTWADPWSGAVSKTPGGLDIDHHVPLGNAWKSGAWQWNQLQRVAYANELTNSEHLVAILASNNRAKADRGPELWKPPLRQSWCTYTRWWNSVKARWRLTATTAEWQAMLEMAATC